jgi:hypothetical protein
LGTLFPTHAQKARMNGAPKMGLWVGHSPFITYNFGMAPTEEISPSVSLKEFLETTPPAELRIISDLGDGSTHYPTSGATWQYMNKPELFLHCDSEQCDGSRIFSTSDSIALSHRTSKLQFVRFSCNNCSKTTKVFALWLDLISEASGKAYKYGEVPLFGPPTPARLISLIGPGRDMFLKGRRSENQCLGIGAFSYYRRIIESEKDRIFDEIARVCKRLGTSPELVAELEAAKRETQFTKAVDSIKHGIPHALLVNGQNPLLLLHSALSEGLHADSDQDCLELAQSIRVVLADFVERVGSVLKDEAELASAVSRLLMKKAAGNPNQT